MPSFKCIWFPTTTFCPEVKSVSVVTVLAVKASSTFALLMVTSPLLPSAGTDEGDPPVVSEDIYMTVFGELGPDPLLSSTLNTKASYVSFTNSSFVSPM